MKTMNLTKRVRMAIALVLTLTACHVVLPGVATAQDGDKSSPTNDSTNENRSQNSNYDDPPLTEREKKLVEQIAKLQQELDDLRKVIRADYPREMHIEFGFCDRNRDSKITQQEWYRAYNSELASELEEQLLDLKTKHREGTLRYGQAHPSTRALLTKIKAVEDSLTKEKQPQLEAWSSVDADGNDIVTRVEFARWWKANNIPGPNSGWAR
jgi:hypothetical protein